MRRGERINDNSFNCDQLIKDCLSVEKGFTIECSQLPSSLNERTFLRVDFI
jgi:hypothetical protein